jgi:hypothetical protein
MNACLNVCGVTVLVIPARRAILRTIRPAACHALTALSAKPAATKVRLHL